MERRHKEPEGKKPDRFTELPVDFTRMVVNVLESNFGDELGKLGAKAGGKVRPSVAGRIFPNEILLVVTLNYEGSTKANSFYCSMDFDPKASSPKADDLLGTGVDVLGALLSQVLEDKHLEALAKGTLSALVDAGLDLPFKWTALKFEKRVVHLRVDGANVELDAATDEWLAKNDPEAQAQMAEDDAEAAGKFVTGKPRGGSDE